MAMIELYDLKKAAFQKILNLGQAEKAFYQDVLLFILYKRYAKELVFKGGTALSKCYGFERFSEDLDFTCNEEILNLKETIEDGLKNFNVRFVLNMAEGKDSKKIKLHLEGPLYKEGEKMTLCSLALDFSIREKTVLDSQLIKLRPIINVIPMFDLIVMPKKEIFSEKIRAIFTRIQARDLYDLYYLDDCVSEVSLINQKLKLANLEFSKKKLKESLEKISSIYDNEMRHLVKIFPDFKSSEKKILNYF